MARVIMTCGMICCGKSTYAKKLQMEQNAVILSIDDITLTLFPEGSGDMHDTYALRAEQYLLNLSIQSHVGGGSKEGTTILISRTDTGSFFKSA